MLSIKLFPCLNDNYGFLIHDSESGATATIDTPEAAKINAALSQNGWRLSEIWNTHHHYDHIGGNLELAAQHGAIIRGPGHDAKRIAGLTHGVEGGESFKFGHYDVYVIATPGHTTSHIIYYIPDAHDGQGAAFVGDTIFVMGCGRLFEGTPHDMFESMAKIAKLPASTKLYCAHEYTLSNGRFALTAEPENKDIKAYMKTAEELRDKGLPTVPTTVERELRINPFLRAETAERLGDIRKAKDNF
jgi:hydroxyacylglutathione hydrolase